MIVTTRTLTCNFCGEWAGIGAVETARDARRDARRIGWRTLPNADQRGRLMDACPECARKAATPSAVGGKAETDGEKR